MRSLARRAGRVALGLLYGLAAAAGAAGEPWVDAPFAAPAAEMLETARRIPGPDGADVLVLYRDAVYEFDAAGRVTYRQRLVFRPLNAQGAGGWSKSEIDYAPWHQQRPEVRARVITPDGREHWLDASAMRDVPAPSDAVDVVADRRILMAPLPATRPGAVVEEEIVVRDTEPFFAAGIAGTYPLRMFAPIRRGRLRLVAPVDLPLRFSVHGMPGLEPRRHLAGDRVELVFEYADLEALSAVAPGLPSHLASVPHVAFSTGESWREVAAAYSRLVDAKIAAAGEGDDEDDDATRLAEIAGRVPHASAPESPLEHLAEIVAEIHREVRYTGLELGASSLIPADPETTLERGFGDCKDQATLLVALLRRHGVPASVALLNAGFGTDVDRRLPGLGRFNHAVVHVPGSPPIWIDPTTPTARPGELPAADQNRWALIADPATEKLLRTPAANSIDNLTVERREVFLADHGPGRVVETSVYRGEQERQQRRLAHAGPEDSRREGYWEYVESTYLAEELGRVDESDPDDFSQPFTLSLEALGSRRAVTDLSEAVVAIRHEGLIANLPAALQGTAPPVRIDRPFVVDQPFVTEWHYRVVPPEGFVPRELPADEEQRLGPARFTRKARREGDEVRVELRFDSGPRFLTPDQYREMRRAARRFAAAQPLLVWFDHVGAQALAAGRAREAIGVYRRFRDEEPEAPIHRIRLAQALLRVGLGGEAAREARVATELDPSSALAWWSLGFALEHDEIGRRFAAGYDREAARAALERAVELDPGDALARTELAILLEYDAAGQRYSAAADLGGAIAQYRILRDELGVRNLDPNLLSALYWSERWEELEATAREVEASALSRYLRLVAITVLRGPSAAIREAQALVAESDERATLLTAAVQHLMIARRYRPAAVLLRQAALSAANPAPLLERAEILERTRRHEDLVVATEEPADLARSVLLVLGRRPLDRQRLEELFHPRYLADRAGAESDLEAAFDRIRQEQLRSAGDLPVEAVLDLALAILDATVEGDSARGYRVSMLNEIEGPEVAFRIYVTRHENRLVIAALEKELGQIGKEVWRRLERDDLRGAHQWLDWARDAVPAVDDDDPYGSHPFARFWTRGTGAFRDKMRLGAAILMADQPEAATAVPVLEDALATVGDDGSRAAVEAALLAAYGRLGDETRLAAASGRLLERTPRSDLAFVGRCEALLAQGRADEVERLARERLELLPDDPEALRFLARAKAREAGVEAAVPFFERLRDAGELSLDDVRLWAWLSLFRDPIPEEALALARRAAEASQFRDPEVLYTLAATTAALDRPAEAHQALLQSLELRDDPRPVGADHYVLGRILESYGYDDAARGRYALVERPEGNGPHSAFELARRRLEPPARGAGKRRGP